jgi:hypothetical protein
MFLNGELNKPPLRNFAGDRPFELQVFELIKVAQSEGRTGDLVSALQEQRAGNILIRQICAYGGPSLARIHGESACRGHQQANGKKD